MRPLLRWTFLRSVSRWSAKSRPNHWPARLFSPDSAKSRGGRGLPAAHDVVQINAYRENDAPESYVGDQIPADDMQKGDRSRRTEEFQRREDNEPAEKDQLKENGGGENEFKKGLPKKGFKPPHRSRAPNGRQYKRSF